METQKMPKTLIQKTHTHHTEATNADLGQLAPMLLCREDKQLVMRDSSCLLPPTPSPMLALLPWKKPSAFHSTCSH